jgi:hypothetical protein
MGPLRYPTAALPLSVASCWSLVIANTQFFQRLVPAEETRTDWCTDVVEHYTANNFIILSRQLSITMQCNRQGGKLWKCPGVHTSAIEDCDLVELTPSGLWRVEEMCRLQCQEFKDFRRRQVPSKLRETFTYHILEDTKLLWHGKPGRHPI